METNNYKVKIIEEIIVAVLAFLVVVVSLNYTRKTPNLDVSPSPVVYSDFESLVQLKKETLVSDKESSNANVYDPTLTNIQLETRGYFSRMYLYVRSSVDNKPLTDWDSIYIKFNTIPSSLEDLKSGGHLFRPKTLNVPQIDTETRLLFNMAAVPYLPTVPYSAARNPEIVNWFDLVFNNYENKIATTTLNAFVSTERTGKIGEISIYYGCQVDFPDCYINKSD